jgi:hypothetical protein
LGIRGVDDMGAEGIEEPVLHGRVRARSGPAILVTPSDVSAIGDAEDAARCRPVPRSAVPGL